MHGRIVGRQLVDVVSFPFDKGAMDDEPVETFLKITAARKVEPHEIEDAFKALDLWCEWFEKDGYHGWGDVCFFCDGRLMYDEPHQSDCVWVRAQELVKNRRRKGVEDDSS